MATDPAFGPDDVEAFVASREAEFAQVARVVEGAERAHVVETLEDANDVEPAAELHDWDNGAVEPASELM